MSSPRFHIPKSSAGEMPKILCLHGAGSSAAIFKVQTRQIQAAFKDRLEFVFAQGPFETSIGPGMQPTFTDSGPFYRWRCSSAEALGTSADDVERERAVVRAYLGEVVRSARGAPFVGIMAFSQGCGVATGLVLDQYALGREWGEVSNFQFAILICGIYPALRLLAPAPKTDPGSPGSSGESDDEEFERIRIPSIHAHGLDDPFLPQSKKLLSKIFDARTARRVQFRGGHHFPRSQRDNDKLLKEINGVVNNICVV